MVFTFAMLAEKAISILNCDAVSFHAAEDTVIHRLVRGWPESSPSYCLCITDYRDGKTHEGNTLPASCIYIASPEECEKQIFPRCRQDSSLAVLPPAADADSVLSALQDAFMFYNNWYDNMLNLIRRGDDWFALVDEGHRVLGNPIILYDRSMKVLAYTRNDHTDDPVWNSTTGSGTIRVGSDSEASELLRYVSRLDQHVRPFKHEGEGLTNPFYTSMIISEGVRCGLVTEVEFHHRLSLGDRELLQVFTDVAALKIRTALEASVSTDVAGHLLVQDLLEGNISSRDQLIIRLLAANWQIHRFFRLLMFMSPLSFMTDGQWDQIHSELMHLRMNGVGCLMRRKESCLYFLISTLDEELSPALIQKVQSFCSIHRLRCGVSNSYGDLLDTRHSETQASAALSLGDKTLNFYSDLRYTHLIRQLQNMEYAQDLIHPAIWKLREIDERTGSEFIRTLHSLIQNFFRQTESASDLNVHRTTLIYRLNRIQELTGLHLDNPQEMLHAAISLEMMRETVR